MSVKRESSLKEGGKGLTGHRPFLFPVKCEMALFFSLIVISIAAVNRDFPKCSLLFSVKHEMLMLYFS